MVEGVGLVASGFQFFTRLAAVFAEEGGDSEDELDFVIFVVFGDVFFMISHIKNIINK